MSLFSSLKEKIFGGSAEAEDQDTLAPELFIYVKIPDPVGPLERGEKYEDKIDPLLDEKGLGEISGGGSALGDEMPDGSRAIAYCGLDVDVTNLDAARMLLREVLPALGAPDGTTLQYTRGGAKLQDRYASQNWHLDEPRAELHPGFGI